MAQYGDYFLSMDVLKPEYALNALKAQAEQFLIGADPTGWFRTEVEYFVNVPHRCEDADTGEWVECFTQGWKVDVVQFL